MRTFKKLARVQMDFCDRTGGCLELGFYFDNDGTLCCNWHTTDTKEPSRHGIIEIESNAQFYKELQQNIDAAFPPENLLG